MKTRMVGLIAVIIGVALIAGSCSSGPTPPQPGTPAFYWGAARQMFVAANYPKVNDNLGQIIKSENEYTARALPWQLIVSGGMAQGFIDLAEHYEFGARAKRDNPTPFRKVVNLYRTNASSLALQFAESFHKFQEVNKDPNITLAFPYPSGSTMLVPSLKRVSSGILVPDAEAEDIQKQMLSRGVLLLTCKALGAGEDSAKAQAAFKAEPVAAPRNTFVLAMAEALYKQSQLFTRDKLDRPDRLEMLSKEALEAVSTLPQTKETKALAAKIQKDAKKKR